MPVGLPAHLVAPVTARAVTAAQHALVTTALSAGLISLLVIQGTRPEALLWPGAFALLPMIALLWMMQTVRTTTTWLAYLIIGGVGVFTVTALVRESIGEEFATAGFSILVFRLALILIGTPNPSMLAATLWPLAGWAVGEVAVLAAAVVTGMPIRFDITPLAVMVLSAITLPLVRYVARPSRAAQPVLDRAANEEALASMRYRVEVRAAALIHDTVLSHLAAIAKAPEEEVPELLRHGMEGDLRVLLGEAWLIEEAHGVDADARQGWQESGLFAAVQEARLLGLTVEVSGDPASVALLGKEESTALGLAVKQCLVNVIRHSGVHEAEVVVFSSPTELSVMIIDAGRGFSDASTGSDRLGLKVSVRRRMESVGGRVRLWSTPGRGTSVMILVPLPLSVREAAG